MPLSSPVADASPNMAPPFANKYAGWRYAERGWTRDLRFDFLRGIVFLLLFTSHFNYFSWFALIGWERIGIVSSAEVFILLAGVVTGMVYGKKLKSEGLPACTIKLFRRAWTLYKIAVIVAGSVAVMRLIPGIDTAAVTSFTDPVTGQAFPLYPPVEDGLIVTLLHVLVLAAGPHQFQIVGLYVVLFLFTPILFWAIARDRAWLLLLCSWGLYLLNLLTPETTPGVAELRLTVCQFEYGFPILAWQLIFVHGVVVGYYKKQVLAFFSTPAGMMIASLSVVCWLALLWFSLNHPLPQLPAWARLHAIDPDTFNHLYATYFLKYKLGPGRVLNLAVFVVTAFVVLTFAWKPVHKALGWLFIPLGQESMYVFFVHIYLIIIVANWPSLTTHGAWANTAIHAGALLLCWFMIRKRFLFDWIPR
jgi:hypothetical protein